MNFKTELQSSEFFLLSFEMIEKYIYISISVEILRENNTLGMINL